MKLLFDQNISFRIAKIISDQYPNAKQVRELGLENSTDLEIWEYAKSNGFAIVTFDSDFYDLSVIKGSPPKIVWLRIGNSSTENTAKALLDNVELIKDFVTDRSFEDLSCLEID
jgi:predicted nuclease of predicted toxin-antitoxin system